MFDLKEIVAVYGKPEKPTFKWLMKKLEAANIPVWDVGVNERTGQVFVVTTPDYASAVLRPEPAAPAKSKSK